MVRRRKPGAATEPTPAGEPGAAASALKTTGIARRAPSLAPFLQWLCVSLRQATEAADGRTDIL